VRNVNQRTQNNIATDKYSLLVAILYECIENLKPIIHTFGDIADLRIQKQWQSTVELSQTCQKVIGFIEENKQCKILDALIDCEISSNKCIRTYIRLYNSNEEPFERIIDVALRCSKVSRMYILNEF
jgi:hypothetical protein